ncbi:hypothetical protein TEA_015189 [Camellia sinensis var. sinensis]|uniref:Protein kinase domain-containing protein n=1 Tax=Camellia sinensis var. sinensis TaxID=542762 RepID=A0A4V6RY33_CAMSN|nr:hypothetical protein TEA_015189 [Camellia sinensis var. sinensis]
MADDKEISAPVVDANDAVTGHIISTTIGGKNGETVAIKKVLQDRRYTNQTMPLIYVKLYTYQIFRGLAYMHTVPGVCHRDLKPQNVLVDPLSHQVKICDFGSAKMLVKGEANISNICSRFYRAPELIFGATEYTTSIDIWSAGCVLAELLLGQPLFPGESAVDHRMPPEAIDLASRLLQYSPSLRCTALEACAHPFFDELREPSARLPNGRPLPPLFNFKQENFTKAWMLSIHNDGIVSIKIV